MKKVLFGLVGLFIVSQFMVSCSSESEVLGQFSKRKYLKKYKAKDVKYEDKVDEVANEVAYQEVENSKATIASNEEIVTIEAAIINVEETIIETKIEKEIINQEMAVLAVNDYTAWNSYNRNVKASNFSKEMEVKHHSNSSVSSKRASEVLIAVLCIFLPPIAVVLYEDGVTTNFWVDLVATLLFWLPGIILAFLICFGGVSF